jgi:hypothetical protein
MSRLRLSPKPRMRVRDLELTVHSHRYMPTIVPRGLRWFFHHPMLAIIVFNKWT